MAFGDQFSSIPNPSPLGQALANRRYYPLAQDPYAGSSSSDILPPIQTEIGRSQAQGQQALSDFESQRQGFRGQLESDLMKQMEAGLTASIPGIEQRLGQLGLLQSGAYPEALERQKAQLLSSNVLPALTAFDTGTFDTASQLPLNTLNRIQGLQSGSLGRQFGLEDQSRQMKFQQDLANKARETEQLKALLGLVPALLGSGGLPGLFGGGNAGGDSVASGGASDGLFGGLGGMIGGAGGGALGSYLGGALGGGTGAGIGGALAAYLGGGGIGGAFGGGIGGVFGGPLGGAIGGGLGSGAQSAYNWFQDPLGGGTSLPSLYNWFNPVSGGDMGGAGVLLNNTAPGMIPGLDYLAY